MLDTLPMAVVQTEIITMLCMISERLTESKTACCICNYMHQAVRLTIFCNNNTTQPHIVQLREVLQGRLEKYILNNKEKMLKC